MKTVWNVLSDNEIMDHPCVQTFANETDASRMVQELFQCYCDEHKLDAYDPDLQSAENISGGKYYRFSGGDWEEWVYLVKTDVVPSTVHSGLLKKEF